MLIGGAPGVKQQTQASGVPHRGVFEGAGMVLGGLQGPVLPEKGGPKKAARTFARTLKAPEVTCFGREAYREPGGWRDLGVSQLFRSGEFTGRGEKA